MRRSDIVAAIEDVKSALRRLEGMLETFTDQATEAAPLYKGSNGRLTDAGLKEMNRLIGAGRSDAEIARILGVTQAAIYRRRTE